MEKHWWTLTANKKFIGRCFATKKAIKEAVGPWHTIEGNHVIVFAPPPE